MRLWNDLKRVVGDISLTAVGLILLASSAIVLPACGFSFAKIIPVDTPAPLVAQGYPETVTLYQARKAYAYWIAQTEVVNQEWGVSIADAEGTAIILETISLQALTTAGDVASAGVGGPLGAVLLSGIVGAGTYVQGSKRTLKKIERGEVNVNSNSA